MARERLHRILIRDRAEASAQLFDALRDELLGVISRYMTVDPHASRVFLDQGEGAALLTAVFPVTSFQRRAEAS
jgi:cell division topological specificity factor